ncbi:hypothetical protein R3P38DRAFT_3101277 [Favolaschia claudopus]|uniref:Uncharacterized protein n=1 Tax=Favolaschia claudopus TaxID=2862362 RepID=A0AAV9ZM53_9AGAR
MLCLSNQNLPYPWIPEFGVYPPNHLQSYLDSAKNPVAVAAGPARTLNPRRPRNVLYSRKYNSNACNWEPLNAFFGAKDVNYSAAGYGTVHANSGGEKGHGAWESWEGRYEYHDAYAAASVTTTPRQDRIWTTWIHPAGGMGLLMPSACSGDDYNNYEGLMPSPGHGGNYTREHHDGRFGPNALGLYESAWHDVSGADGYIVSSRTQHYLPEFGALNRLVAYRFPRPILKILLKSKLRIGSTRSPSLSTPIPRNAVSPPTIRSRGARPTC